MEYHCWFESNRLQRNYEGGRCGRTHSRIPVKGCAVVIERGGEVPFRKAGLSVGGLCWIYPSRNDEAHANLISAAPDGLLLAKAVVENGLVGVLGGDVIFRMALNLIAKAEGRE